LKDRWQRIKLCLWARLRIITDRWQSIKLCLWTRLRIIKDGGQRIKLCLWARLRIFLQDCCGKRLRVFNLNGLGILTKTCRGLNRSCHHGLGILNSRCHSLGIFNSCNSGCHGLGIRHSGCHGLGIEEGILFLRIFTVIKATTIDSITDHITPVWQGFIRVFAYSGHFSI
jgi:hypothetical protein